MALDLNVVMLNLPWVIVLLIIPVIAKLVLIVLLSRAFNAPMSTALRTGFYLAQAGEFALVMLALASDHKLFSAQLTQTVLAAMIVSMLTAPLLIQFAEPIVRKLPATTGSPRAAKR